MCRPRAPRDKHLGLASRREDAVHGLTDSCGESRRSTERALGVGAPCTNEPHGRPKIAAAASQQQWKVLKLVVIIAEAWVRSFSHGWPPRPAHLRECLAGHRTLPGSPGRTASCRCRARPAPRCLARLGPRSPLRSSSASSPATAKVILPKPACAAFALINHVACSSMSQRISFSRTSQATRVAEQVRDRGGGHRCRSASAESPPQPRALRRSALVGSRDLPFLLLA